MYSTFEQYKARLKDYDPESGLREGQYAFNLLFDVHPSLASQVNGTWLDTFYLEHVTEEILVALEEKWGSPQSQDEG